MCSIDFIGYKYTPTNRLKAMFWMDVCMHDQDL